MGHRGLSLCPLPSQGPQLESISMPQIRRTPGIRTRQMQHPMLYHSPCHRCQHQVRSAVHTATHCSSHAPYNASAYQHMTLSFLCLFGLPLFGFWSPPFWFLVAHGGYAFPELNCLASSYIGLYLFSSDLLFLLCCFCSTVMLYDCLPLLLCLPLLQVLIFPVC